MPDLSEFEEVSTPPNGPRAEVTVGPDGGDFSTGVLEQPLDLSTDWDNVLRGFGLDPDVFEVVDDTVRMSKWQQSKRTESGDRDIVWLYSYKARFRRRTIGADAVDVEELRTYVRSWNVKPRTKPVNLAPPSTFLVLWADWQLGKSAGGGVARTVERIEESFGLAKERLEELRKLGRNIERVAVVNMGDPTESCDGHYDSQLFSVELTQREQLNVCLDLWLAGVRILRPNMFGSVLCNHGEWTRKNVGSRAVTTDSDNVSGYLADTLYRVFENAPGGPDTWEIPHDNMVTTSWLSGVHVAFTHGHKIPSAAKELEWLKGQSLRILRQEGAEPRLWITAHRHHVRVDDYGPWWRLQCPSLDGGSKWFADTAGQWATPGTMTLLVGNHDSRGWSDLAVLGSEGDQPS